MSIGKTILGTLLALSLAACGSNEGDTDAASAENPRTAPDAASADSGESKPAPPDPEEIMDSTDQRSREVWSLIQEEHSRLTEGQQRSLQACAELAIRDRDVTIEQAVKDCYEGMKEEAQEQSEEES